MIQSKKLYIVFFLLLVFLFNSISVFADDIGYFSTTIGDNSSQQNTLQSTAYPNKQNSTTFGNSINFYDDSANETSTSRTVGFIDGIVYLAISLIVDFFVIFPRFKMLSKTGRSGWLILVPFYGRYLEYKYYWKQKFFWILLVLLVLTCVCTLVVIIFFIPYTPSMTFIDPFGEATIVYGEEVSHPVGMVIFTVLIFIFAFAALAIHIIMRVKTLSSFGKSKFLIVLEFLGLGIINDYSCGISSAKYCGPLAETSLTDKNRLYERNKSASYWQPGVTEDESVDGETTSSGSDIRQELATELLKLNSKKKERRCEFCTYPLPEDATVCPMCSAPVKPSSTSASKTDLPDFS